MTDTPRPAREPWIVLLPLSLAGFLLIGAMLTSLSVYTVAMQAEFGWSAAELGAGPVALLLGMSTGNLLVSTAMRKTGPRGTFATGAALAALGWGAGALCNALAPFALAMGLAGVGAGMASIVPGIAVLNHMFHARRGSAIALFIGSCALASSTVPMATNALIAETGWRTAFAIVGALALVLVPILWRSLPAMMPDHGDDSESATAAHRTQGSAFRSPAFWMLTTVLTLSQLAMNGVLFHLVPYLQDGGLAPSRAVLIYSITNFMSLPGLLVGGYLSDRVQTHGLFAAVLLVQGMGTFALLGMNSPGLYGMAATVAFVVLWGGVAGLPAQVGSLVLREVAPPRHYTSLLGVVFTVNGFIGALAPALAGWLRDTNGAYGAPFLLFSLICVLSTLLSLSIDRPSRRTALSV